MTFFLDILGWFLLGIGALVLLIGAIGLVRLPDFFTRMHAAGLIDTLGAGFVLAGLMIEAGWSLNLPKLLMILVFLLFTSPTSSHALVHAALARGLKPWQRKENGGQSQKTEGNDPSNR
jgi:multicomponent Na+:H+ antiporter subunit G